MTIVFRLKVEADREEYIDQLEYWCEHELDVEVENYWSLLPRQVAPVNHALYNNRDEIRGR